MVAALVVAVGAVAGVAYAALVDRAPRRTSHHRNRIALRSSRSEFAANVALQSQRA